MVSTIQWIGWANAIVVCFAGCGTSAPNPESPETPPVVITEMQVTFHVPRMCERLKLM